MRQRASRGFTLIELMLAMSFVSILLIAIAMLTIQMSRIYTKGISLRQVNEAGLELSNDLQRSIQSSAVFDMTDSEGETSFLRLGDSGSGRLCLGSYSYAWNYGKDLGNPSLTPANHYGPGDTTEVRFVKVADSGKRLCKGISGSEGEYPDITNGDETTELLATGDRNLAVHKFTLDGSKDIGLYSVQLVIGTNDQSQLSDDTCKPPSEADGGEDYCAVNKFDIVARAGSKEGSQ